MNNSFTSNSPLTFSEWLKIQGNQYATQEAYLNYLNGWYNKNKKLYALDENLYPPKEKYVQLIKDLIHLFDENEKKDLFLIDIDFNNDEDLVYIIPYLASKLKQISQLIAQKREELKKVKIKNEIIGSSDGLEKILYENILKNFTSKPYQWTKIPISPLANRYPQLSSVKDDFYIEVEELYDTNNYYDSDPSVLIEEYFNIDDVVSKQPYENLTDEQLAALVTARFFNKIAPTTVSKYYNNYLTYNEKLSSEFLYELSEEYTKSINNQMALNQAFLGENIYALTAIRNDELNEADYYLSLPFEKGHNWFYWPSGDKGPDPITLGNIFKPVSLNQSNLLFGRTVSGSSHLDSDLFFVYKDNTIEGAWLQGSRSIVNKGKMSVGLNSNDKTEFIFPWVGFEINSKDLTFKGYSLNDADKKTYQKLNAQLRSQILNQYFTSILPNSSVYDVYLNQTNLIKSGANSAFMSDLADTISVSPTGQVYPVWNESTLGSIDQAFLYKFITTDIFIANGINDILWPIQSFESGFQNLTLTLSSDTCVPIVLGAIEPSKSMVGAVAGSTLDSADVIYKFLDNGGTPMEAAWLASGRISQLDQLKNSIPIYATSAINCSQYIDGPIQPSLYMKFLPGEYTSFVWMDEDTLADDVFKYMEHSSDCAYGNSFPHDYYSNQDYQNPTPLNGGNSFPLKQNPCTCKAVNYSPVGTEGKIPTDYASMGDLLFADPQGLGSDYNYNKWRDTRDFPAGNSPQFSFYKIDGETDRYVGFGDGMWVTGNGTPMVLKTGRRYTYYRTNFRINGENEVITAPYMLVNYPYKNINVSCGYGFNNIVDLVILIDNSRTQYFSIVDVKKWAKEVCREALESNPGAQISIISFASKGLMLNYLSNDLNELLNVIENIQIPEKYPNWLTNITEGLILANNVLFTNQPPGNDCNFGDITKLCKGLSTQIVNQSKIGTITNCPRPNSQKKILMFSDGQETKNEGTAEYYAQAIKNNGVEIMAIDIGFYALTDKLMEKMASPNLFFNLQQYLLFSDVDINRFLINITTLLMGCFPATPTWCKAIRSDDGVWTGMNIPSDMVLNPGDYLGYVHRDKVTYVTPQNINSNFDIESLSFALNVKLDGWDYYTNEFNLSSRGDSYGGKPFWGKLSTPSASAIPVGGGSRLMDDYVTLHQPEVSEIILKNGNYITYKNSGRKFIKWEENLSFNCLYTDQIWNKLKITKKISNLEKYLKTKNITDFAIESTTEPSDLYLESYSTLNPTKYSYYVSNLNSTFTYNEKLFYIDRCNSTYVVFTSGIALKASNPHMNLENINYATMANICFPATFKTEKQIGSYLLPNKLGVSYYRGIGYDIELDPKKVEYLKSIDVDLLFSDPQKYGPRNRGLTKQDQLAPLEIKNLDNRWIYEPYGSTQKAGIIIESVVNQKLTPYQSNYEINSNNQLGVSLQKDNFQFWDPKVYNKWTDKKNYPLTVRNEVIIQNFTKRTDALLINIGVQDKWKTDIYGNNFGLFKGYDLEKTKYMLTEVNEYQFISESGLRFIKERDYQ
jgi:hypothetical protein